MNFGKMNDKQLYEYCRMAGLKAREWKNRFVATLPEVAKRGLHKRYGFATVVEFAAKVGGVGKSTVEKIFQLEKRLEDKPALKELLSKVGVSKIRVVATIATKENQKDLAEKVQTMSKQALELFANAQREQQEIDAIRQIRPGAGRVTLSFSVDKEVEFQLRKFKQEFEKKNKEATDWNAVMKALLEKVQEPPKKTRNVKPSKKITRYIPVAKRRETQKEFKGRCAFPACNKPSQVLHHPQRFALTKNHNNLKPLCKPHHEIAHHGFEPKDWKLHPLAKLIDQKTITFIRPG